jgi:prephenate dehydrogenase
MSDQYRSLCLIGVGLIGGSFALALRRAGLVDEVVGYGRSRERLGQALALGVIDRQTTDLATAVQGCGLIVLAVPLGAMPPILAELAPLINETTLITDVGSAKGCVVDGARAAFGRLPPGLVPGHPIAGRERSGVDAADVDLFSGRRTILTPLESSADWAIERLTDLWHGVGAEVTCMSVAHHDEVLAATSHLPHLLAYTLVDTLAGRSDDNEIFGYAAGGFRDFTRIASSDPVMWRDICIGNRGSILDLIDQFSQQLTAVRQAVDDGDGEQLLALFTRAKQARDNHVIK